MSEQNGLQTSPAVTKWVGGGVSIFEVNFIYLLTMGLVIVLGSLVQAWSLFFGLILTELFLILLPALLYMAWKNQMTFTGLRMTWPGPWVALAAISAGLGLNLFAIWLTVLLLSIFGYSSTYGASLAPKDLPQAYLAFLGFAIFAPLCEEILFRGVILRGYEGRGFWRSIVMVAVLFAAYHLSLPRFIAILPVALALNWTASRSRSIGSSMLMHFGYNGVSAVLLDLSVILPDYQPAWYGTLPFAGVGVLLAAAALVLVLGMALADFMVGRSPNLFITQRLALQSTGIDIPATWQYELRNAGGQVIGKATCQRTAQVDRIHLECEVHQEAYQLHSGNSFYQDTTFDRRLRADWEPATLYLIHLDSRTIGQQVDNAISVDVGASKGLTLAGVLER